MKTSLKFPVTPIVVSLLLGMVQLFIVYDCISWETSFMLILIGILRLYCLFFTLGNVKVSNE